MTYHIGYKKCRNNLIIKLQIRGENNELRLNVKDKEYAKFRCSKALVMDIYDADTKEKFKSATSFYKDDFIYKIGEVVKTTYDENINDVCALGIHYYLCEDAAYWHDKKLRNGKWVKYHDNGQLREEGMYKNWKKEGKWTEYYVNGKLHCEGMYKDGKQEGKWTGYHDNGTLRYEGMFKDGKREGKFVWYHSNGRLQQEGMFKDGKEEGKIVGYHSNDKLYYEGMYKNGKQKGKWVYYE